MEISKNQLIEILKKSSAKEIGLSIITNVKMNKKNNPLYESNITKSIEGNFKFGYSFSELINESITNSESDETYTSRKLPWGEWVKGAEKKIVQYEKNGVMNYYLRYYNAIGEMKMTYLKNGIECSPEDVETITSFLPKKKEVNKGQADLGINKENKVVSNMVSFDNIKSLTIDNVTYTLS